MMLVSLENFLSSPFGDFLCGGFVMYYFFKIIFIIWALFFFHCSVYWICAVVSKFLNFDGLALFFVALNPLLYKRLPRLCSRTDRVHCKLWNCPEFKNCHN